MNIWFILAAIVGARAVIRAARQQPRLVSVRREKTKASAKAVSVAELNRRNKEAQKKAEQKSKAMYDLPFLKEQIGNLCALLDIAEAEYAATTSVTKQAKFLRQINSLNKQIHAAEAKYNKAKAILAM